MPFDVGDSYTIYQGGSVLNGTIVNSYEYEPGLWVVIIKEPQTGTLLKRLRTVKKSMPMALGGAH